MAWLRGSRIAAVFAVVVCVLFTSSSPASALPPLVCFAHITPAGEGQFAMLRPVENGVPAYQIHAGQDYDVFTNYFDSGGIRWRVISDDGVQPSPAALPLINLVTGVRYATLIACDQYCQGRVCKAATRTG